jgi:hypothetical protein
LAFLETTSSTGEFIYGNKIPITGGAGCQIFDIEWLAVFRETKQLKAGEGPSFTNF